MKGILYGVGIGPGDPELMTVKARRILAETRVLAVPAGKNGEKGTARAIVEAGVDCTGKRLLELPFSMRDGEDGWRAEGARAGELLLPYLEAGETVAMAVLGDVTVYSTFLYVQSYVREKGFETCMVPGISAYSACAAQAGIGLLAGQESLAVLTGERLRQMAGGEAGTLPGQWDTAVLMKAGGQGAALRASLEAAGLSGEEAWAFSNIGMEGAYAGPLEAERTYGYFTTVIARRRKERQA